MTESSEGLTYEAFLSHRYRSPEINTHFFDLFSSVAEVQFKVDRGTSRISMTRLTRMVRDADAFIGIYPLAGEPSIRPSAEEIRTASRYFRVELDLAIRSGKPTIVFLDQRYRTILRVPAGTYQYSYDPQEIARGGGTPTRLKQAEAVRRFSEVVSARMQYEALSAPVQSASYDTVGLLLPDGKGAYSSELVRKVSDVVTAHGYDCRPLPNRVDSTLADALVGIDWILVDIGSQAALDPMVAYLHGRFVPMLLLDAREPGDAQSPSELQHTLFGAFEVGYVEDILTWRDANELLDGLARRLAIIDAEVERLNTIQQAREYFASASRRKERVFISYAGSDEEFVRSYAEELRLRFQDVFDYKTAGAIAPGSDWMHELFQTLSSSAVGVIFVSSAYLSSGACRHEAEELVAQRDAGRTRLFVIRVDSTELPAYLRAMQFIGPDLYPTPVSAVGAILKSLPAAT